MPSSRALRRGPWCLRELSAVAGFLGITARSDWFTRDDSQRARWEAIKVGHTQDSPDERRLACERDFPPGDDRYLCQKQYDVKAVMAHEMGHALGLHHPESVDSFVANGSPGEPATVTYAKCKIISTDLGSTTDEASMCSITRAGRTTQRTLENWDMESLWHSQYVNLRPNGS